MKLLPPDSKFKIYKIFLVVTIVPILVILFFLTAQIYSDIQSEPLSAWEKDPSADCGLVLTGGGGRIREGISLLTRGFVKKLIISGVNPEVDLHQLYQAGPNTYGWNDEDIILEKKSATTFGNAQQSWPIIEALGCRSVVLLTSQLHMPRAYKTFQKSFPEGFTIQKHTIPFSQSEGSIFDISTEVLKSLFYASWAY